MYHTSVYYLEKLLNYAAENLTSIGLILDIVGTIFALKTFVFLSRDDANRMTVPMFSPNSVVKNEQQNEAEKKAEDKFYSFRKDARWALIFLTSGFILQIIGQFT